MTSRLDTAIKGNNYVLKEAANRASEVPDPIACVGMGYRLAGDIRTPAMFWDELRDGSNCSAEVSNGRSVSQNVCGAGLSVLSGAVRTKPMRRVFTRGVLRVWTAHPAFRSSIDPALALQSTR